MIATNTGKIYTSATAANGSWTLKLTVTGTSPGFLLGRGSYGALGFSFPYIRSSNQIGHAYSATGATWSATLSSSGVHGDPFNYDSCVLDNSLVVVDNVAPATGPMTLGVFTALNQIPVLSTDCRTLYGVLQDNCFTGNLKRINDQLWYIAHNSAANPSYLYCSAPFKKK